MAERKGKWWREYTREHLRGKGGAAEADGREERGKIGEAGEAEEEIQMGPLGIPDVWQLGGQEFEAPIEESGAMQKHMPPYQRMRRWFGRAILAGLIFLIFRRLQKKR